MKELTRVLQRWITRVPQRWRDQRVWAAENVDAEVGTTGQHEGHQRLVVIGHWLNGW